MNRLITLTTDFGLSDGYVASMKGVIFSISPGTTIVDITHQVRPQNVLQAGIVLASAIHYFPDETIHVAVVDPGVGSDRSIIAARANNQTYLAPDNGLLSLIFDRFDSVEVREIDNRSLFLPEISKTFHGRDIFAPVAAHLSAGLAFDVLGPRCPDYHRGLFPSPQVVPDGIRGQIVYCDHFGNLMTNIRHELLSGTGFAADDITVELGRQKIRGLKQTYSDCEPGEVLCLIGSAGYLEIAIRDGSAKQLLQLSEGTEIRLKM